MYGAVALSVYKTCIDPSGMHLRTSMAVGSSPPLYAEQLHSARSLLVFTKHVFVVISTCSDAQKGEDLLHRLHLLNLLSVFASLSFLKNSDVCMSLPVSHTHPHMQIHIHSDSPCSSAGKHDSIAQAEQVWCKKIIYIVNIISAVFLATQSIVCEQTHTHLFWTRPNGIIRKELNYKPCPDGQNPNNRG